MSAPSSCRPTVATDRGDTPGWVHAACLGGIVAVHLGLRLWAFGGLRSQDDILYSGAAHRLAQGEYVGDSPWSVRYLLVVPLAVAQHLFGVTELVAILPSLAYSTAALALVYALGRSYGGVPTGLLASALWALFPLDVAQATELHLDVVMTVFVALSMLLWRAGRSRPEGSAGLWLAAGAAFGAAQVAKETAFVHWAVLGVLMAWRRRWWPDGAWLGLGFLLVVGLEMTWYAVTTGDPLYRFSATVWQGHLDNMVTRTEPVRWMLGYANVLLNPFTTRAVYAGGFFAVVVAATVWGAWHRDRNVTELTLWWGTMLVALNFMPRDWTFRDPLFHHEARTAHVVFVPGLILAAYALTRAGTRSSTLAVTLSGLLVLSVASISLVRAETVLWADHARRAFRLTRTLPDAVVVTDPVTRQQLSFFHGFHEDRLRTFQDPAPPPTARVLWLYDPFWIDWTRRYWRWSGPPPPPECPARTIEARAPAGLPALVAAVVGSAEIRGRWHRPAAVVYDCPASTVVPR